MRRLQIGEVAAGISGGHEFGDAVRSDRGARRAEEEKIEQEVVILFSRSAI
jgi:hypothetical protein